MLKSTTEQERIMLAFHFDFNTAHFQADYIMRRLETLSSLGYDTVIWEMEDAVRFDCAPALATSDAFTREEWRRIIQQGCPQPCATSCP